MQPDVMSLPASQPEREQLRQVLAALDPDPRKAEAKYQLLYEKLVKLFCIRGFPVHAHELAMETLERLEGSLAKGEPVRSLPAFAAKIAHYICLETAKETGQADKAARKIQASSVIAGPPDPLALAEEQESELQTARRRACLDSCVQALDEGDRQVFLGYYYCDKGRAKAARRHLAKLLKISGATLRQRARRARMTVEACVTHCATARVPGR
jgi:RNA polymerase sigma factor (sigma-70 family)